MYSRRRCIACGVIGAHYCTRHNRHLTPTMDSSINDPFFTVLMLEMLEDSSPANLDDVTSTFTPEADPTPSFDGFQDGASGDGGASASWDDTSSSDSSSDSSSSDSGSSDSGSSD